MSDETIIKTENVGKMYEMGIARDRTLLAHLRYWIRGKYPEKPFWALKEVSIDVKRGEIFGIVGPNGAGKSTLLRIISGILQPSEGAVTVRGKINPFLQITSGLFPELTVLENINICATLLGYSVEQIRDKLPKIIEFAEIEKYLYSKLRTLSTGYASRLAFSVALHADLDIMLIDEMLAVGDARFRKKSEKAFAGVVTSGRTVLYAAANVSGIGRFCPRSLYLRNGRPVLIGDTADVLKAYERDSLKKEDEVEK